MSRRRQTTADYAVTALCPSLIVLLLASLVYFVILCMYRGQYSARLGYIWFMFILGAVGIARLSIEQSRAYATGYAAVLGIATFFVLSRFQSFTGAAAAFAPLVNAMLIGGVWFLADRITFDCTLIDDEEDASGRGLLDGLSATAAETAAEERERRGGKKRRRKAQPGRTVLALTAAALPMFGLGQVFLGGDSRLLSAAMWALGIYLFAALSLLVATSFLGIRRYLRQRGAEMPSSVSAAWLGGGVILTMLLLAVCFLLPQPGRMLAEVEVQLPVAMRSSDSLTSSRYGWGGESVDPESATPESRGTSGDEEGESDDAQPAAADSGDSREPTSSETGSETSEGDSGGEGEAGGENESGETKGDGESSSAENGQSATDGDASDSGESEAGESGEAGDSSSDPTAEAEQDSRDSSEAGAEQEQRDSADDSDTEPAGEQAEAEQQAQAEQSQAEGTTGSPPPPPPPPPSPPIDFAAIAGLLKLLIYAAAILAILLFLWVNRAAIRQGWQQLMQWLYGRPAKEPPPATLEVAVVPEPVRHKPFAAFADPFRSGIDPRRSVIETFHAAEAWYREHDRARGVDETPHEYASRLTAEGSAPAELKRLAEAYNRITYGGGPALKSDLSAAKQLWQGLRKNAPAHTVLVNPVKSAAGR